MAGPTQVKNPPHGTCAHHPCPKVHSPRRVLHALRAQGHSSWTLLLRAGGGGGGGVAHVNKLSEAIQPTCDTKQPQSHPKWEQAGQTHLIKLDRQTLASHSF